ncbi:hypothetical protein PIB30_002814 [Stylosanthes scabra]|uniref:Uncharacterized protein n=1 Tax=Stylosanthes scabra TaxID=79078 RepID=A0ABU6T361_9FABA|nr:hypothetical protein [Stylosanthes scabra]
METESLIPSNPTYYGGIKSYLRRKRYQHGSATPTRGGGRKAKVIRLKRRARRYWRIRTIPKLRWVITSPLKMLIKLKNAYMNFMLRLAGNFGALNTENDNIVVFGGKRIRKARQFSKRFSGDAFEARLIYEISKTFIASHELYPM